MLVGAFSFAVMSTLAHQLSQDYDWRVVALVRTALAFVFAIGLGLSGGARFVLFRPATIWMRSIAGSVSLLFGFYAVAELHVSEVLTLTNMFPIWVALLAWPMLRYVPSPAVWIAVASGVAGIVLMQRPQIVAGNLATLAAIASSFTSALAMIGLHRLHQVDSRAIVAHFSGLAMLFCLVALIAFPPDSGKLPPLTLAAFSMFLGMGASATLGQVMLTKAFATGKPDRVSVVSLSQVAFAMLFEMLLWHRSYSLLTLGGMALVVAPTAWLLLRRRVPVEAE